MNRVISTKKFSYNTLSITRWFFVVVVAVGVMGSGRAWAQAAEPGGAVLVLEGPAQVAVGGVIELRLRLEGAATAVGGFEAELLYDPAQAEYSGFAPAAPVGEAGIGRLAAPLLANGSAVGFYTCDTQPCLEERTLQVAAAAESGALSTVELVALGAGSLEIRLGHVQVVDTEGRAIALTLAVPSVVVQVGEGTETHVAPASGWSAAGVMAAGVMDASGALAVSAADVTGDHEVAHGDVMEVALAWESVREGGDACSGGEEAADVNGDGCVDVQDVQAVAARTGEQVPGEGVAPQLTPRLFLPWLVAPGGAEGGAGAVEGAAALTIIVNSTGDEIDRYSTDSKCLTIAGTCTLRAAIQRANQHSGPDTVTFAILGAGVQTIQLGSRLPALSSGGTTIDGYSQIDTSNQVPAAVNTDPAVSNARILVQVRGNGQTAFDGMAITSAGNVVKGLALFNLKRSLWVYGAGAHDNLIVGNFIGTDAAGSYRAQTFTLDSHGIHVEQGAHDNHIGGVLAAERNVISGNGRSGIGVWHVGTRHNVVFNNLIGLSPDGLRRLANNGHGVDLNFGAASTIVGGLQPGERNVVSGNFENGAEISHTKDTTDNHIIGNYIGTDASGNAGPDYAANIRSGISIKDRVTNNVVSGNVIGNNTTGGVTIDNYGTCCIAGNVVEGNRIGIGVGDAAIPNDISGVRILGTRSRIGPDNIIANNPVGINLADQGSDGNTITQNSIFANVALGIDIAPLGQANPNDAGDGDSGPNQQQNYPVLNTATTTQVTGIACITCTVEIFIADTNAATYGEGRTFVSSGAVAPDGTFAIPVNGPQLGNYVTATATDAEGNTSEFSLNRIVAAPPPLRLPIPGRIESEDYKPGGEGIGYHDTTVGNTGGAYRTDDVDIELARDTSGNYDVGWIASGEWLAYDVDVLSSGSYNVVARVAAQTGPRRFHIEIDGVNVSGPIAISATGGMHTWADVSKLITLTAGQHTLRFVAETNGFNVNYLNFVAQ